jgi:AraC-like DNA-binding protein
MLEETDKLISDIAGESGFYDQSHFTKTFFRERGLTPGEYRRRHRNH